MLFDATPSSMTHINREANAVINDPMIKVRLAEGGFTVLRLGLPAEFGRFLVQETEKWARWSNSRPLGRSDPGNSRLGTFYRQLW
jgi:hypothetical protein